MSAARRRLPNRRLQILETFEFAGQKWQAGFGFDRQGRVREIFVDGLKSGSGLEALLDDAAVLASLLLQRGARTDTIASSMGRTGTDPAEGIGDKPSSPIGAILERAALVQKDNGAEMRRIALELEGARA